MRKFLLLFLIIPLAVLLFYAAYQTLNNYRFDIDGKSIKYQAMPGYCAVTDRALVNHMYHSTQDTGIAVFYPCLEMYKLKMGEYKKITGWIQVTTPKDPKLRNFEMPREEFIRESVKLIGTMIIDDKEITVYGGQEVPEDFKRPTPLIMSSDHDENGIYQTGQHFYEWEDDDTVTYAVTQASATTLIKGKVITVVHMETDFENTKSQILLEHLRKNMEIFVRDNP